MKTEKFYNKFHIGCLLFTMFLIPFLLGMYVYGGWVTGFVIYEDYDDKKEWFLNISLFISGMFILYYFFAQVYSLYLEACKNEKKRDLIYIVTLK